MTMDFSQFTKKLIDEGRLKIKRSTEEPLPTMILSFKENLEGISGTKGILKA